MSSLIGDKKLTIIYDNTCTTCNIARAIGETLDTEDNLDFVGMETPRGKGLVHEHGLAMEKSAYAIKSNGNISKKAEMVHTVLSSTNFLGRAIASCLKALPQKTAERVYEFAAKHRDHRG